MSRNRKRGRKREQRPDPWKVAQALLAAVRVLLWFVDAHR